MIPDAPFLSGRRRRSAGVQARSAAHRPHTQRRRPRRRRRDGARSPAARCSEPPRPEPYSVRISILRALLRAFSSLGSSTVSTPLLKRAVTLSATTSEGSGITRENAP